MIFTELQESRMAIMSKRIELYSAKDDIEHMYHTIYKTKKHAVKKNKG
jgi:hypothetical protein